MTLPEPTLDDALALLYTYTATPALRNHGLGVAVVMRAYAAHFGEEPHPWELVGLLHDFDYERWPEAHPQPGSRILAASGYSNAIIEPILGHATPSSARPSLCAKSLYAVDELVGFVTAVSLVTPGQAFAGVTVQRVLKKLRNDRFAASINRVDLRRGAEELGVPFEQNVEFVIAALQAHDGGAVTRIGPNERAVSHE